MKAKRTAFSCLLARLLAVTILINAPRALSSETVPAPCVAGRTAAPFGFWTWPSNSHVNVYLRQPDFSEADLSAVKVAVENWDVAARESGSRVRFIFRGLTRETRVAAGDMT